MAITFKAIELVEQGKYVSLKITGKLDKEDYEYLVPELEAQIERCGKLNMLIELDDFKGWSAGAAWEDAKFGLRHFNDIERLAIIGDSAWEKGMTFFVKPFTRAKVKYFDARKGDQFLAANDWLSE